MNQTNQGVTSLGVNGKRVAIIGAGPGGILAGLALHRAGFDVKVFERYPELRPLGGAIILNATGIVILRSLGVRIDDVFAAGCRSFVATMGGSGSVSTST